MYFEDKFIENLDFGRSGLNLRVFEKLFISYSCILFIIQCALKSFYIKMLYFSKIWFFQTFDRSNLYFDQSKLRLKFSVFKFLTNLFFHASFMFRIHMHCIVFVSILQFCSHIFHYFHTTCIHFGTLGTQLDQKIDWLIFELCTF